MIYKCLLNVPLTKIFNIYSKRSKLAGCHNQVCQISTKLVQGLRNQREAKMTIIQWRIKVEAEVDMGVTPVLKIRLT